MGNSCVKSIQNDVTDFQLIKDTIRPFDMVLFSGSDFVSDFIRWTEEKSANYNLPSNEQYSHCGVVVTSEILDDPNIIPGHYYVLESTVSGILGQNIKNIENKSMLGVQIRDLEALIPAYIKGGKARVSIGRLTNHPFNEFSKNLCKKIFTKFYERVKGKFYDVNLLDLGSSVCFPLRKVRNNLYKIFPPVGWYFCSELAAELYQKLDMIDTEANPGDVVPMDFAGYDIDQGRNGSSVVPKNFLEKIIPVK